MDRRTVEHTDRWTGRYLVVVGISEGETEIISLQQVGVFTNLLKELMTSSSFLRRKKLLTGVSPVH